MARPKNPRGNETPRRYTGGRPLAAIVSDRDGNAVLRLVALTEAQRADLRRWASDASAANLEDARRALGALLGVVEDEQANRFQAASDAEDKAEERRILDDL